MDVEQSTPHSINQVKLLPSNRHPLEAHLIACVQENLSLCLYENAVFLCERLVAEFATENNVFLLATCHHRSNQYHRAYQLLKDLSSPASRYLFATCCIQMGNRLSEAEAALLPDNDASRVPHGAAGLCLLGKIYQLSNRHANAIAAYNAALILDPMMWCAFEELCTLGADTETKRYVSNANGSADEFSAAVHSRDMKVMPLQQQHSSTPLIMGGGRPASGLQNYMSAEQTTHQTIAVTTHTQQGQLITEQLTPGAFVTPDACGAPTGPPAAPKINIQAPPGYTRARSMSPPLSSSGPARKFDDDGKLRKISNKLFADPASVIWQSSVGGRKVGVEEQMDLQAYAGVSIAPGIRNAEGQEAALSLLRALGVGLRFLSFYKCRDAIAVFDRLPANQKSTGWVLMQLGRAHFELVEYSEAAKVFAQAHAVDPYRLKGLEYYSTVLWHMKREVELSYLAQDAVATDRMSPHAWCVMGNCFSLQKEHETALRFFQRALQLDPTLPYAYTLSGHEYFANEDFDKGIACYRNATRIDPRHYNAWFGMGLIYFRQEKWGQAEYHFRRAVVINPGSSVLHCYMGMALSKLERLPEALQELDEAAKADPRNPLAKFEKATVLIAQDRLQEALKELEVLRGIAPREASVLYHMGKLLKRLERRDEAMACFSAALDLHPASTDTNLIKSALDRIHLADEEEEEEI